MAHSHLLIQHLLKQLEHHKRDREERQRRPEWLSAFVYQTAALFEPMKGVGNERGFEHLRDAYWVTQHGARIVLRMHGRRHLDPSQLLACCPELVHMSFRCHRIQADKVRAIRLFKGTVGPVQRSMRSRFALA